jgi:gamma-glutamyltranspeptidase/glutathione hydrolase
VIVLWSSLGDEVSRHIIAKKAVEIKIAKNAMVASENSLASLAGNKILKKGGNAVDAAVATHFALAVVKPCSTGFGGGGRCCIRMANGEAFAMNFEPMTPGKESPFEPDPEREASIYKVSLGRPACIDDANLYGYKAAAIPGFVKGMSYLVERFGNLDLSDILEPAIKYAEEGYLVDEYMGKTIAFNMNLILRFPETAKILLKDGLPLQPWGRARWTKTYDKIIQKDLADTLRILAKEGPESYYRGQIAQAIVGDMENNDGHITTNDLASYKPEVYEEPGKASYRGYDLYFLPVSTGIPQILSILDGFDLKSLGYNTPQSVHLIAEAIKLAYASRSKFLGLGIENRPFKGVATMKYAEFLGKQIKMDEALSEMDLGDPYLLQGEDTTHACVVDKDRNIAGVHSSLGDAFGCKVTIKGTGIILNNKMKDYDPRPDEANSVRPHTIRPPPSSSAVMLKDGNPAMVVGSPGGYKQVTAVIRTISNIIDYDMNIQDAMNSPRIFAQTGKVFLESSMPGEVCNALIKMGHDVIVVDKEFGFAFPSGIVIDQKTGLLHGGVDRLPGVTIGY